MRRGRAGFTLGVSYVASCTAHFAHFMPLVIELGSVKVPPTQDPRWYLEWHAPSSRVFLICLVPGA